MDKLKKSRRLTRTSITKKITEAETGLTAERMNMISLQSIFERLDDLLEEVNDLNNKIVDGLLDIDSTDEQLNEEREGVDEYDDRIRETKIKLNKVLERPPTPTAASEYESTASEKSRKRNFKLPKIELRKFSGDLKDWIGFWSQFSKIHEDTSLHDTDKFQYLVQAMDTGSEAKDLVCSYPQSAENYPKAVEALQERFGRDNLLLQVYVRELLKLVINNATQKEKIPLARMYISLESHLRALASLNLSKADPSTWLFPLVESSLPLDILKAWQRSPLSKKDGKAEDPPKSSLDYMMEFIKSEVQSEQQIELAQSGFQDQPKTQLSDEKSKGKQRMSKSDRLSGKSDDIPTITGLHIGGNQLCLFCENNHPSKDCGKARKMTIGEKTDIVKKKGCCLICFKKNHRAKDCKSNYIKCLICDKKHYEMMCPDSPIHKTTKSQESQASTSKSGATQNVVANFAASSTAYLGTFRATLVNGNNKVEIRALYDPGAQRSYLTSKVAEELELIPTREEKLSHSLFGGVQTAVQTMKMFQINIKNNCGQGMTKMAVLEKDRICGSIPRVPKGPWMKELKAMKIWISDMAEGDEEINLLIGADMYGKLLTGRTHQLKNGMTAIETLLGWIVMGSLDDQNRSGESTAMTVINMFVKEASPTDLWNLETIGIQDPSENRTKIEEESLVKQQFLETVTRLEDGRYSVALPWIDKNTHVPDNKKMCESRLMSITTKLNGAGKYETYQNIFDSWEKEGIIELVSDTNKNVHYLPHHPVFKPDSTTTPVRPVFDASCQTGRNPSLNDCLHKGPNLLEVIPSILLRFRERKFGVVSDIRKAFQMIEVNDRDRDFQRFLWWETEKKEMKIYRHCRVVFGINCSPFLLGAVLEFHLNSVEEEDKAIAQKLLKSFYVDNCVTSLDSIEEYDYFKSRSTSLLAEMKMDLRQWEISSQNPRELPENERSNDDLTAVLGYKWDKKSDTIMCKSISEINQTEKITKRTILSEMHKIFDPMGFLCPAMIAPKILFQRAWIETESKKNEPSLQNLDQSKQKRRTKDESWNQELSQAIQEEYKNWRREASILEQIQIPRCVKRNYQREQIHVFSDASQHAYAAVVFLRVENEDEVSVQMLQAKSRVAPYTKQKKTSIPRLELLSCTIATRLTKSVKEAMDMEETPTRYWTDSTTALAWIQRNNEWGTFVGNRVREINQLSKTEEWHHVPGVMNPADLPSRGCRPSQLRDSKWWEGPEWLKRSADYWPSEIETVNEEEVAAEMKKTTTTMVSITPHWIWKFLRYSRCLKNVKIVAMMLRWRYRETRNLSFTIDELNRAEHRILQIVQNEVFPEDVKIIEGLHVIKKDGLYRVKTKIQNRNDCEEFKYPILLPSHHPWVHLLIWDEHMKNKHASVQTMMAITREKYWIVKTRRTIRDILSKCVICKRFTVQSPNVVPAPLPEDRVRTGKVFETIGVDLAGPFYLTNRTKVYVVLFTCAVYRCLHLEVTTALSTDAFLDSFSRFCARRGRPNTVYCDNGTNFVGANTGFKSMDWKKIEALGHEKRILFKFNPPSAPWWGGWWERLVRMIKDLMRRTLGKSTLNMEKFTTLICEIEAVVNRRPLTTMTEDPNDFAPLTPATFLTEMECPTSDEFLDASGFQKSINERKELLKQFKMRFRKEYLALLVHRGKEKKTINLKVGDVVLIGSDNKRRWEWPMAKIEELIPGRDGNVRLARVKTSNGILLRALQRLYPLEVSNNRDRPGEDEVNNSEEDKDETDMSIRPKGPKKNLGEVHLIEPKGPKKNMGEDHVTLQAPKRTTRSGRVVKDTQRFGS